MEHIIVARVAPKAGRVIVTMTIFRGPRMPSRWCSRLSVCSNVARAPDNRRQDAADREGQPLVSELAWQRTPFVL